MARVALISFLNNSINTRSLSSYLKSNGHEVTCYFCQGDLNTHNLRELTASIKSKSVLLVGVSLVTDDFHSAVVATNAIKKEIGTLVVWGGAHVNVCPEECLRHADIVCLGEGEEALLELVDSLNEGKPISSIKNMWLNENGNIIKNELRTLEKDLDKYPFPDFDLTSQYVMTTEGFVHLEEQHLKGEYSIMSSRGCPYRCKYCYNSYRRKQYEGKGQYLRARSIENVIQELMFARRSFPDLQRINFWDDSFVARGLEDFTLFKSLYTERINLPFFALVEPMAFQFEKIKLLKESGLEALQVGIQSGSERVNREIYNRLVSNNKNLEVARYIHELGIDVTYDLIFNNPYERREDIVETINLFLQFPRPFWLQGFNLIFYPGTELSKRALQDGFITTKQEKESYTTIQSKKNSPISMGGSGELSSRFYDIRYNSREKVYLNTVLSLIAYRHIPSNIIKYFSASENRFKYLLLRIFSQLYVAISRIKNKSFTDT